MRVAVIGRGNIGGTLGRAFAKAGHDVTYGSRHPRAEATEDGAVVVEVAGAIEGADVVLLAIPAGAVDELLAEHADAINGMLVIDATNLIGAPVANAAAQIRQAAPEARYVRAFNTLGWENFARPVFDGIPGDLFFSAPPADRALVEELISAVGLRSAYLGEGKENVVDGALALWFSLVQARGGNRHLAFRVLDG
jgi:predicted dinucleotide-binding enzyme